MSRYYTNVTIPDPFCKNDMLVEQITKKDLEISILRKKLEDLYNILENIPNAIEEWGYVNLDYDNGKKKMRIVKYQPKSDESSGGGENGK